jgi:type II secretory pathway pseudopilin PulG
MTRKTYQVICRGYTLIEVLVAGGILVIGIAAAASLAMTMVAQEKSNARVAEAFNIQEQAGRLYQLGLTPTVITNELLPYKASEMTLQFQNEATTNVGGAASMQTIECVLVCSEGSRTNTITLARPTTR